MRSRLLTASALLAGILIATNSAAAAPLSSKTFSSVRPENLQFEPFPAFPPGAKLVVVVGDPSKPGPYVVRVTVPNGVKMMPHVHPEDRIYTVISGVFYIGLGKVFDPAKLVAYGPGSVVVLPANTPHFHWARSGDYTTQVNGYGPLGLSYVDPKDDPRHAKSPGQ
jgi:quercetin dioxygenase-like cupin family protein